MLSLRGGIVFSPRREARIFAEGRAFLFILFVCPIVAFPRKSRACGLTGSCFSKLLSQGSLRMLGLEIIIPQFSFLI